MLRKVQGYTSIVKTIETVKRFWYEIFGGLISDARCWRVWERPTSQINWQRAAPLISHSDSLRENHSQKKKCANIIKMVLELNQLFLSFGESFNLEKNCRKRALTIIFSNSLLLATFYWIQKMNAFKEIDFFKGSVNKPLVLKEYFQIEHHTKFRQTNY